MKRLILSVIFCCVVILQFLPITLWIACFLHWQGMFSQQGKTYFHIKLNNFSKKNSKYTTSNYYKMIYVD